MFVLRSNWFTTKDAIYWVLSFSIPYILRLFFLPQNYPKIFLRV